MTRPYFEPDRESNRPAWETEDNWRSEEFWQDLLPVAEWRVELEKHRALEESSSRNPSSAGGGSSSVQTQTLGTAGVGCPSELTDCRSINSGAGGAQGSVPPALPSEEN